MGLFSWLRSVFSSPSPSPFMARPALNGGLVSLHWPPGTIQLDVYLETPSPAAEEAVFYWNAHLARRFFAPPIPPVADILRAFADPALRAHLKGCILVRMDESDSDHGSSDIEYDKRTGGIINAVVTLPGRAKRPAEVAMHELGHCLGLNHGPDGTLMAAHLAGGPVPLAGYQARAVKDVGR